MVRELQLMFKVTRNYGTHEIEVGHSEMVEVADANELIARQSQIEKMTWAWVTRYESEFLETVKGSKVVPTGGGSIANDVKGSSSEMRIIPVAFINVEFSDGKRRVKVGGGQFQGFGVMAYDDSCQSEGIDLKALDYGKHIVEDGAYFAKIEMQGDKPKRVVAIYAK